MTELKGEEFGVRPYRPGDETRIIELFERTFGRPMGRGENAEHWKWEFLSNPSGRVAVLLAECGPRLAAQYAVLPLRVQMNGVVRDAALSLDTATDPDFRGRGLFPRLARQLYSDLAADGFAAVFGFPNAASAPIFFRKLGWAELAPFPLLVKLSPGAVARVLASKGTPGRFAAPFAKAVWSVMNRRVRAVPRSFESEPVADFPEESDALWERARTGKRICVVRDRRYLSWRYSRHPDGVYRSHVLRERGSLVGSLVMLVEERFSLRSAFVMDLLAEESRPDVAAALVSLAESRAQAEGAEIVSGLMFPGTVAYGALRAAGFIPVPRRFLPQEVHFGVCPLAPGADESLLRTRSNWYVTWGDADTL
jgi:GNAT superfamily N-acetyltransferase